MDFHFGSIFGNIVASVAVYLFFCVLLIDPEGRATVYAGHPLYGFHTSVETNNDPTFRFFSLGALIWTIVLIFVEQLNPTYCSIYPETILSWQTLFALLTIMLATKIFGGPALEVRKSIRLVGERKFIQPVSFKVYDAIKIWPVNFTTSLSWKLVTITILAFLVWVLNLLGIWTEKFFLPYPIIIAWVLASMGRLARFIIHRQVNPLLQIPIYIAAIGVLAIVWGIAEMMFERCGLKPGSLPSMKVLAAGVLGTPLMESIIALLTPIF